MGKVVTDIFEYGGDDPVPRVEVGYFDDGEYYVCEWGRDKWQWADIINMYASWWDD